MTDAPAGFLPYRIVNMKFLFVCRSFQTLELRAVYSVLRATLRQVSI